ncbi:MAG: OB-fold nucleic acid binding domain-containing protein, partial [Thermofilaceae archaeon]
ATSRTVQLGELKARVTLLERVLREPVTENDLAQLEARLQAIVYTDSPRLQAFLKALADKETLLPFPLVFSKEQLALAPSKVVAAVGKVSSLRKSNGHLFFNLNDIPCVFFNYPFDVNAQLSNNSWAAVIGGLDEYNGSPQIRLSSTDNIIPAR